MDDAALLQDASPVSRGFLAKILHMMAGAVAKDTNGRIEKTIGPLERRLSTIETRCGALTMLLARGETAETIKAFEQLEARIIAIEKKPVMRYAGVWESTRQYNFAELVTHAGSLHHCNKSTRDRPGESSDWTLCAKRGKDGRDGKDAR